MKSQDNIVIQNCIALRDRLNNNNPGLIKELMPIMTERKYCTDTTLFLNKQKMIDDLADILNENNNVNILYARRTPEKKHYEVIAYSMPYDGEMFVIKLQSAMYGAIDRMNVSFYMSLDIMFIDIRAMFLTAENDKWIMLEKQKPYVLFSNFN